MSSLYSEYGKKQSIGYSSQSYKADDIGAYLDHLYRNDFTCKQRQAPYAALGAQIHFDPETRETFCDPKKLGDINQKLNSLITSYGITPRKNQPLAVGSIFTIPRELMLVGFKKPEMPLHKWAQEYKANPELAVMRLLDDMPRREADNHFKMYDPLNDERILTLIERGLEGYLACREEHELWKSQHKYACSPDNKAHLFNFNNIRDFMDIMLPKEEFVPGTILSMRHDCNEASFGHYDIFHTVIRKHEKIKNGITTTTYTLATSVPGKLLLEKQGAQREDRNGMGAIHTAINKYLGPRYGTVRTERSTSRQNHSDVELTRRIRVDLATTRAEYSLVNNRVQNLQKTEKQRRQHISELEKEEEELLDITEDLDDKGYAKWLETIEQDGTIWVNKQLKTYAEEDAARVEKNLHDLKAVIDIRAEDLSDLEDKVSVLKDKETYITDQTEDLKDRVNSLCRLADLNNDDLSNPTRLKYKISNLINEEAYKGNYTRSFTDEHTKGLKEALLKTFTDIVQKVDIIKQLDSDITQKTSERDNLSTEISDKEIEKDTLEAKVEKLEAKVEKLTSNSENLIELVTKLGIDKEKLEERQNTLRRNRNNGPSMGF